MSLRGNRHRLDLHFFRDHGGEAAGTGRLGDLADGEREAFCHERGSGDDDHLVRLESYTHTLYLERRLSADRCASYKLDGDARHRVLSRFGHREGVIPTCPA